MAIAALTSANATILLGARTSYAVGRDFPPFAGLGRWHPGTNSPTLALAVQGAIALALVFVGAMTRKGVETMIEFTAPVFWFFFLLAGISLFLLPSVNLRLRPKLLSELKPRTKVVSHNYDMGDWKPEQTLNVGNHVVYMWTVPERGQATGEGNKR